MKKRLLILGVVAASLLVVIWLKPKASPAPEADARGAQVPAAATRPAVATVLLFGNPREAKSSCGCATITRLVHRAGALPGVIVRELDARRRSAEARRYGVRLSPTVIILGPRGAERARFEGESGPVIARLRAAIDALGHRSAARGGSSTR